MVVTNTRCVSCYGIDGVSALLWHWPKNLVGKFFKILGGSTTRRGGVEGLQPKLQETPRIFFGLWSYLAGQTFLAIVLREDCLWAVRNLISEFKAVSGPETVVRQGALCRVHCLRNLVLNPNSIFFPSTFDFWFLKNRRLRRNIEDGKSCCCGLCANCIVPENLA